MKIKVYKEKGVVVPSYATEGSAGLDLRANEDKLIMPGETQIVKTGLFIQLPAGYMFNIVSRSGLSTKGIVVGNAFGVVDADYTGEICVIVRNTNQPTKNNDNVFKISKGDRIAQGFALPIPKIEWEVVESKKDLTATERGDNGFGSSGVV